MANIAIMSRRYQEVLIKTLRSAEPLHTWQGMPGPELCALLEQDCVPLARVMCGSPSFQYVAKWPLRALVAGSETTERRLIDELKQEILLAVELIRQFTAKHRQVLEKHFPKAVRRGRLLISPPPLPPDDSVVVVCKLPLVATPCLDEVDHALNEVEAQCQREWVSALDYFRPRYETTFAIRSDERLQRGEFIVGLNPKLQYVQYVGNSIARCLLVRAAGTVQRLKVCAQELQVTLVAASVSSASPHHAAIKKVQERLESLRDACLQSPAAQLAEAAICLVQVAVGFSAIPPDLGWLPAEATEYLPQGELRYVLEDRRDLDTAQVLGEAFKRLRKWEASRQTEDSARDEAIATGGLVVIEASREVYWRQQAIPAAWKKRNRPWELLLALAKSRGVRHVSLRNVYGDKSVTTNAFTRTKNLLGTMLPRELKTKIEAISSGGELCYRLNLPRENIHVLPE